MTMTKCNQIVVNDFWWPHQSTWGPGARRLIHSSITNASDCILWNFLVLAFGTIRAGPWSMKKVIQQCFDDWLTHSSEEEDVFFSERTSLTPSPQEENTDLSYPAITARRSSFLKLNEIFDWEISKPSSPLCGREGGVPKAGDGGMASYHTWIGLRTRVVMVL